MIRATLGGRPGRRWVFYGLACLCLLMFSVDMMIVSVALRTIVEHVDRSLALGAALPLAHNAEPEEVEGVIDVGDPRLLR